MNELTVTVEVSTKARKDVESGTKTSLTINWEGMEPADIRALAQQALIVKLQGGWRKNGIPTSATVKASDHKVGSRSPVVRLTPEQQFAALNAEGKKAFLAKLQAMIAAG